MKELYLEIRDWLNYCRIKNYKENKQNDLESDHRLIECQKKIEKLEKEKSQHEFIEKERENLALLRERRIQALSDKLSSTIKRNKELRQVIQSNSEKIDTLNVKLQETEEARRKSAGSIGGLKAQINKLTKKLDEANYTINFYKTHRKSPSLEELKAYEYSRKEVERRIKNND